MLDCRVLGVGAAGSAIIRLLKLQGAEDIIGCGRNGALGPFREEDNPHRNWLAQNTNPHGLQGSLKDAFWPVRMYSLAFRRAIS